MATIQQSLYAVVVASSQGNVYKNVVASTLGNGIDCAINSVGSGASLVGATQVGGKPIDVVAPAAVAPMSDTGQKFVYSVSFQSPSGAYVAPLVVESNAQINTTTQVVTSAYDLAIQAAATAAGVTPSGIQLLGGVDAFGS